MLRKFLNSENAKVLNKTIAMILVITLTFANFLFLGEGLVSYANDEEEPKIEGTQEFKTNKVLKVGDEFKRFIQLEITTKTSNGEGKGKLIIPETVIENVKPEEIRVTSYTNKFEFENNTVEFNAKETDKFIVTYIYAEDAELDKKTNEYVFDEEPKLESGEIKLEVKIEKEKNSEVNITAKIDEIENKDKKQFGDIVTIQKNSTGIFKGNMYLNNPTEYSEMIKAEISLVDEKILSKKIEISQEDKIQEKNIIDDVEKFDDVDTTINYKATTFSKSQIETLFANDEKAYILVTSVANNTETKTIILFGEYDEKEYEDYKVIDITKIDNDEKEIKIEYAENTTEVKFETSIPTVEGILKIKNDKEIVLEDNTNVKSISKLKSNVVLASTNYEIGEDFDSEIKEPATTANLSMEYINANQTILSSLVENKVKFTINLISNGPANELFENPTFKIDIPENITVDQITDYSLALNDGLSIKEITNINNTIIVVLDGKQENYNYDEIQQSISIGATLKLDRTTPSGEMNLAFSCENKEENIELDALKVAVYSPAELISVSNITVDDTTTSIEEKNTNKIAIFADEKTAKVETEFVNNIGGDIQNVTIKGVFADEGSTISTNLINEIKLAGLNYTIKYLKNNEEVTDIALADSFEIIIDEMKHGEEIKLAYELSVQGNLSYNEVIVNTLNVTYIYEENTCKKDLVFNITTGIGPSAKIEIVPEVENGILNPGQIVTYNIEVENDGDEDIESATLAYAVEKNGQIIDIQGTDSEILYTTDNDNTKEFSIKGLKAGEKVDTEVTVKVDDVNSNGNLVSEANLKVNDEVIEKNEVKNEIQLSNIELTLCDYISAIENIDGEYQYLIKAKNISNASIKNATIKMSIPDNVSINNDKLFVEGTDKYEFNNKEKEIICNVKEIKAQEEIEITVTLDVDKILPEENNNELKIQVYATIEANGCNKVQSNMISHTYYADELQIKLTSDGNVNLNAYDDVNYTITVNNTGKKMTVADVEDIIPEEISVNRVTYSVNNGEENEKYVNDSEFNVICALGTGDTLNINYIGTVKAVDKDTTINHIARINLGNDEYIESDVVTNVVEKENVGQTYGETSVDELTQNTKTTNTDTTNKTLSIIGTVWQDENGNGKKESTEKTLEGISVNLINSKTGELIKNSDGEIITVKTDANGTYTFENLEAGEYKVIFKYDSSKYQTTLYHAEGIAESVNSDATSQTVTMSGEKQTVALTDTIKLENSSVVNIDLGLKESSTFDLSLTKQIKKVTVKNDSGTTEYDFSSTNTSKIEIPGKYYKGSTLVIEYNITVKNEGDVTAYVTDILDYMPKELTFNSEMNTNWYNDSNGTLHNISLSMEELEPGKTVTETVILTKTIDTDNAITITNEAEIGSSTNTEGLNEKDSTNSNKNVSEDDYSKAELIVSIKTGGAGMYIGITLISLIILTAGIYIINKKVLKGNI